MVISLKLSGIGDMMLDNCTSGVGCTTVEHMNKREATAWSRRLWTSFLFAQQSSKMPGAIKGPRTLYDKVFQDHIVNERDDGTILLYIGKRGWGTA